MNIELADILELQLMPIKEQLIITELAGLVRTYETTLFSGNDQVDRLPVPATANDPESYYGQGWGKLIPDEDKRAIVYFEDGGTQVIESRMDRLDLLSDIRLVCWYNGNLFRYHPHLNTKLIALLMSKLQKPVLMASDHIKSLKLEAVRFPTMDAGIFARYTYNTTDFPYLKHPFGYFAIDLRCTYSISYGCLDDIAVVDENSCC